MIFTVISKPTNPYKFMSSKWNVTNNLHEHVHKLYRSYWCLMWENSDIVFASSECSLEPICQLDHQQWHTWKIFGLSLFWHLSNTLSWNKNWHKSRGISPWIYQMVSWFLKSQKIMLRNHKWIQEFSIYIQIFFSISLKKTVSNNI